MRILLNVRNFFIYFSIIFFISFLFYMIRMFGSYNIAFDRGIIDYLYLFIIFFFHYFFPLSILVSIFSVLFISTGLRFRGGVSVIISFVIISLVGVVYPFCMKYLNYDKISSFIFGGSNNVALDTYALDKDLIYSRDGDFIYVGNVHAVGYEYQDVTILNNYNVISAKYANESEDGLDLVDVSILDMKTGSEVNYANYSYQIQLKHDYNRFFDMLFAYPLLDYLNLMFSFFIKDSVEVHVYVILCLSLFLLFVGFYTIGGSLSVSGMRFHNIAIAFIIYFIFILSLYLLFTFASSKMHIYRLLYSAGAFRISLFILVSTLILNTLSLLLHYFFRFDKYYK